MDLCTTKRNGFYIRTKVSGPESLELALEMNQRKKEKLTKLISYVFKNNLFEGISDCFSGCVGARYTCRYYSGVLKFKLLLVINVFLCVIYYYRFYDT